MMKTLVMAMIVFVAFSAVVVGASKVSTAQADQAGTGSVPAGTKELSLDLGNGVSIKLVRIPAGKFLMGSPNTEKDRCEYEGPQHELTISKPFFMGMTHVTVDQFAAFVKDSGHRTDAEGIANGEWWRKPRFDQKGDHPVVNVSWNDAKSFCDWLSKRSGKKVCLPTEAQWEYACRAGTKTAYPWGNNPDDGKGWANCADQTLKKTLSGAADGREFFSWDDGFAFTSPVGSFKVNAFGLYDMTGNAWQWCADRFSDYKNGAALGPTGADTVTFRVLRGGSCRIVPALCRSAARDGSPPVRWSDYIGFRVAVVAEGVD
jgi:formylglycine-generating enzyme required for sulfatase activity